MQIEVLEKNLDEQQAQLQKEKLEKNREKDFNQELKKVIKSLREKLKLEQAVKQGGMQFQTFDGRIGVPISASMLQNPNGNNNQGQQVNKKQDGEGQNIQIHSLNNLYQSNSFYVERSHFEKDGPHKFMDG